jgi:hypothetical protein
MLLALKALRRALAPLQTPWMIIGGIAVQARGVARTTRDIDATIRADRLPLEELVSRLKRAGIRPRVADFEDLARHNFILLLEHVATSTPIDLSLAWIDFEQAACARATLERFGDVKLPVIRLDDLLVLKTVAWRARDQGDVRSLLASSAKVDLGFVEAQVRAITEAMEEEDRVPSLRRLVAEVRPAKQSRKKSRAHGAPRSSSPYARTRRLQLRPQPRRPTNA